MLRVIGLLVGTLILKLVYGKRYNNENNKIWKPLLVSVAFILWLLCIGFLALGLAEQDYIICLSVSIGFPIAIIIWAIIVRLGNNQDDNKTLLETPENKQEEEVPRKHTWRCDKCGKMITSSPCEFCNDEGTIQ